MPGHAAGAQQAQLAAAAETIRQLRSRLAEAKQDRSPVAIIGMALRMPGGSATPAEFWSLLRRGEDATGQFPQSRADAASLCHPDPDHPGTAYVIRGAFIENADGFDPAVFGISPREATGMDPQQRIALELAWEALEAAGYSPTELAGHRIGVYLGVSTTDYVRMRQQLGDIADVDAYQLIGEPSFIAGRISYSFGLRGPSMVIDTTCSSSLVCVHQACQALAAGECDMALAGGVNLMLSPYGFVLMSKFRALAADGRCKTFDASADGYARGEGAGLVVLKRLPDATASSDSVLAVIRGSAVNHDGRSSGITVPSPEAQQEVIRRALAQGGVRPADITYVEAHGTGTALGDPIELRALDAVLGEGRRPDEPLLVGSVKTNVGHLEPAAGIAGLVKAVLAVQHGEIPPHLNFSTPNPNIPWRKLRLRVPTTLTPWPSGRPRLAAVSSFGASGTNAHVIVGAADRPAASGATDRGTEHLLLLSARSDASLRELAARYARYLDAGEHDAGDVCFTSQVGRARHERGLMVAGRTTDELSAQLRGFLRARPTPRLTEVVKVPHRHQRIGWLLGGQGSQYRGMAAGLRDEPAFAAPLRDCASLFAALLPQQVEDLLWGPEADPSIDDTRYTQPCLFAVQYALGRALLSWGVRPAVLLGHSIGEITAACLAGAIDLPDATRLVAGRARLMAALPAGGVMAAVGCDEQTARQCVAGHGDQVSLAAVNGVTDVVLSGAGPAVQEITSALAGAGYRVRLLNVSHAFHSPLLEPMLQEFGELLSTIRMRPPGMTLISNVTGQPWGPDQRDARYWLSHARATVRFGDGVEHMHADGIRTFVDLGPHPVLTGLGRSVISDPACVWLSTLSRDGDDRVRVLSALGALHLRGCRVDWQRVHASWRVHASRPPRRVPGPGYPWDHKRFWFPAAPPTAGQDVQVVAGLGARVRAPEPVFEEYFAQERPIAGAGAELGWLVERSVRAAAAGLGGRWHRLHGARAEPCLLHEAQGPWLAQTAVRDATAQTAHVVTAGASPEEVRAGAPWHRLGVAGLERAAGPGTAHASAGAAGGISAPVGDDMPGDHRTDEAGYWGNVVRAACAALAASAGCPGWASAFAEANCAEPRLVRDATVARRERTGDALVADVMLRDADGRPAGSILGLRWEPAPAPASPRWHREDRLVYTMAWVPAPAPARAPGAGGQGGRILLVGAGSALGLLAQELGCRGAACTVAMPGPPGQPPYPAAQLTDGLTHVIVNCADIPGADRLSACSLVSHLLPAELLVVRLARQIAERSWPGAPPRLVVLTRGAVPAAKDQRVHNPAGATLWGLGRVIALEHPASWGMAIDLDPDHEPSIAMTADTILSADGEDQIALRGDQRLVARLRPVPPATLPGSGARPARGPGTVLITGGWGGIGMAIAEWLAAAGTERLVLAGRTPLPAEPAWDDPRLSGAMRARVALVRRLRAMGTTVEAVTLDVTDEAAVRTLASRLAAGSMPLRGVIHAAGVSAPQDLTEVDEATYRQVWEPKTVGAWLLHQATRDLQLDFFVCFSSVAATWGSQHLASYAAANMFLDGLAHYRHSLGLPCLAVDWGPWGLPSGLYGADVMSFLEAVGLRQLAPAQCLALLPRLLRAGRPQYIVCAVDWERYKPVMQARGDRPVLADIQAEAGSVPDAGEHDRDLLDRLFARSGEDSGSRLGLLTGFIRAEVARVLGTDDSAVPADADVFALGLDSLMVMEVAAICRRRLGIALRPSDFFTRNTLGDWASHLDEVLGMPDGQTHGSGRVTHAGGLPGEHEHDPQVQADPGGPYTRAAAIASRSRLAPDIQAAGTVSDREPGTVLLTGATGFVGAFMLDELLTGTSSEVMCLVRAKDRDQGLARVRHSVERYLPWRDEHSERVHAVVGDLTMPRLGLGDGEFASLAERVGAIYHAGAQVDFVHTFDQLAAANIAGTQEVLRLACHRRPKRVEHVSTYGIWGLPVDGRSRIGEGDDISTAGRLVTGYVQTKWGAEHLMAQAWDRGLPVRTFRLGRVLGDSRSGVSLTTHFTCRVIKGCIQLGLAPDLDDLEIEMTPVDYIARALVYISGGTATDAVFHLINPRRMRFSELVRFIECRGWPLEVIGRQQWWQALRRSADSGQNVLHPVMDTVREFIVGGEQAIDYDVTRTEKALAGSGIGCAPLDGRLLETYFGYFIRSRYLTKPTARSRAGDAGEPSAEGRTR